VVETSCCKSYKKKEKEHKKNTSKCQKKSKEKIKRKWQKRSFLNEDLLLEDLMKIE